MKIPYWILLNLVILSACAPSPIITELADDTLSAEENLTTPATESIPATPAGDVLTNATIKIVGDEEIVFDWTNDSCEPEHIPDLAARAFRDRSGQAQLIISHYVNYRMVGDNLDNLLSDCQLLLESAFDADPGQFNDAEWIAAPYTEDGETIFALIHNEYRGHTHEGQCPSGDYFECLDTSITLAVSKDGGNSYADAVIPPEHLVATLPYQIVDGDGPFGLRTPSNIIKGQDGYYYNFSNVSDYATQEQWVCLMRTDDLADPRSWRFWNGSEFKGQFADPYHQEVTDPYPYKCAPLARNEIGASLNESITYNTYLDRYVLIGISADSINGREVWGFYYAFSDDLIEWTHRKLLLEIDLPWTVDNSGSDTSHLYPALLDPSSDSRNFETSDKTAFLYFTRMNMGAGSLDRDLIRVPIEFFPSE